LKIELYKEDETIDEVETDLMVPPSIIIENEEDETEE